MNYKRPTKRVGDLTLPVLPERYDYTGQVTSEGSIVQVKHVATGQPMNMPANGFVNDYDKAIAVLDSIMSCIAFETLNRELALLGKTVTPGGEVIDLPPELRPLRADASDANPENGGNETS